MASNGTLVRSDLTTDQWADFRKVAIDLGITNKQAAGDALRDWTEKQRTRLTAGQRRKRG